jgi:hypothetical protein
MDLLVHLLDAAEESLSRLGSAPDPAYEDLVSHSLAGDLAVARLLMVERNRVRRWARQREVYAFPGPDGEWYFPRWQFVGGRVLPGLRAVLEALPPDMGPAQVSQWFVAPNPALPLGEEAVSPVAWLAAGEDPQEAVRAARWA